MRVSEATAHPWKWRPVIGLLPGLLLGVAATITAGLAFLLLPWFPRFHAPLPSQIVFSLGGAAMLILLAPSQIKALGREMFGYYTVDADAAGLRISWQSLGLHGSKHFAWREIARVRLSWAGIPRCEYIRIDPAEGYWFSFGAFFDRETRAHVLAAILAACATFARSPSQRTP